jgi:hypothetical protein
MFTNPLADAIKRAVGRRTTDSEQVLQINVNLIKPGEREVETFTLFVPAREALGQ